MKYRVESNQDGLAEKLGAKRAKKLRRNDPVKYTVPIWLTKAINIALRADAEDVDLLNKWNTPRKRFAIVRDTRAAQRTREKAALTGIDKTEQAVQDRLGGLSALTRERMLNRDEAAVDALYAAIDGLASGFEELFKGRDETV